MIFTSEANWKQEVIHGRRYKALYFEYEKLILFLTGKLTVIGVPEDSILINTANRAEYRDFQLIIAHPSFDPVPLGEIIPMLDYAVRSN